MANGYQEQLIDNLILKHKKRIKNKNNNIHLINSSEKDTIYIAAEYPKFTPHLLNNITRNTRYKIAYKTTNKLKYALRDKNDHELNNELKCGIYKIKCDTCNKFYIGQTGRTFKKRYLEHLPPSHIETSKFASQ